MRNRRVGRLEKTLRRVPGGRFLTSTLFGAALVALLGLGVRVVQSSSLANHTKTCEVERLYSHFSNNALVDCFVNEYKNEISAAGKRHGVPPELIAATIRSENVGRPVYEDWKDSLGSALGLDVSLGVGQVKLSTAIRLDKSTGTNYSRGQTAERLGNPRTNIDYMAKFYRGEMDSLGRKDPDNLLYDTATVAELGARYVGGRRHDSQLASLAGTNVVAYLMDRETFAPFGRPEVEADRVGDLAFDYVCNEGVALLRDSRYAKLIANGGSCEDVRR